MERAAGSMGRFCLKIGLFLLWALSALGQQSVNAPQIPPNFKVDLETAARLRPQLVEQSMAAGGRYASGRLVLERLVDQLPKPSAFRPRWELRIVDDGELNAYSSPDGTIYVETGLAELADQSAGLWAAILSHEIAHVVHRDWARRYLYQKSLEGGAAVIALGDPGLPSASWTDAQKASAKLGQFCRQMEIDADREGLMLMARAGYHPDFVPALHHLLHAHNAGTTPASIYAMHPCWEERDRELLQAYVAAGIEFEHRWQEGYSSPGGNPPILVFAESPTVRKNNAREWEVQLPIRCENLAGAVEVVLVYGFGGKKVEGTSEPLPADFEVRQLTGCTSPRTTVSFTVDDSSAAGRNSTHWANLYVLDASGGVLARADIAKLR